MSQATGGMPFAYIFKRNFMRRYFALLVPLLLLTACGSGIEPSDLPPPLGDFALGYSVVVAPNLVSGPLSRKVSSEAWTTALKMAIDRRFETHQGPRLYHIAVSLEGYLLAKPGVPFVLSPKSALILNVTIWDDAAGVKLNAEPHQITVLESFNTKSLIGSGITMSRQEQFNNLVQNAALSIESWLETHPQQVWFSPKPNLE